MDTGGISIAIDPGKPGWLSIGDCGKCGGNFGVIGVITSANPVCAVQIARGGAGGSDSG